MSDKEVLTSIKNGGQPLENATQYILQSNIGLMYDIKSKLNLQSSDIKDMYADAISNLIWNVKTNKFKGESKVSTYLYKILYNKSIDHLRHLSTNKNRETIDINFTQLQSQLDVEHLAYQKIAFEQVKKEILNLGEQCRGVIMDWGYYGFSMKEIANRNNIDNADKAKKAKYNCLQKLRSILKSQNIF